MQDDMPRPKKTLRDHQFSGPDEFIRKATRDRQRRDRRTAIAVFGALVTSTTLGGVIAIALCNWWGLVS